MSFSDYSFLMAVVLAAQVADKRIIAISAICWFVIGLISLSLGR